MKTLHALKITSILNSIYCICCIASAVSLTINQYYSIVAIEIIGMITLAGWLLNPTPPITFLVSLVVLLDERHSSEARQIMGKKYVWVFIWPVIIALFYFIAMGTFINITGGV